jgi:hypothetical protein
MKALGVILCLCFFLAPSANAGAPDPAHSTVSRWDTYGLAFVSPGVYSPPAVWQSVTITVLDDTGNPCPGVAVTIDLSDCGNLCIDSPDGLSGVTNESGVVVLDPRVGGCETCDVVVRADAVVLRTFTKIRSTDWDGSWADGIVNAADSIYLMAHYNTYCVCCADYTGDGRVNLTDYAYFMEIYGDSNAVTCPFYSCDVFPTSVAFGTVPVGEWKDTTFVIRSTGGGEISGSVSESCDHYSIVSGGGPYSIAAGDSLVVTVRFGPTAEGTHTCTIETGDDVCQDVFMSGTYGPEPLILSIEDVGNDQGRSVRIDFHRSTRDAGGSSTPILQYEAFRRIDPLPSMASEVVRDKGAAPDLAIRLENAREHGMRSDAAILLEGWEYACSIPAHGEMEYNMISPTLADSTIEDGMHWSVFFIRAATANPLTYFDSPIDSGYSLDNLAPEVPEGFLTAYNTGSGNRLSWDPSPDVDFQYFRIFRAESEGFEPSPENLVHVTIGTDWIDGIEEGWRYYYKITALDYAGNESDPASPTGVTDADVTDMPRAFALHQNVPNPFNPNTVVRFEMPIKAHVSLRIYDAAGRLVRALVEAERSAGRYGEPWDGRDSAGKAAASGIYFYRLEAGAFTQTRKMVLLR